jgi:hypothetical protein
VARGTTEAEEEDDRPAVVRTDTPA